MKISSYHFLSLLLPLSLSAQTQVPVDPNCCGNDPEGTVLDIKQSASVEAINARRSAAVANGYQKASISTLEEKVEIKTEKASFLAGSEFLVGAKGFAIVPKGSTVTPSRGVKILSEAPTEGRLQTWREFQVSNPSSVRLLPVSDEALSGEKSAVEAISKKITALKTGGIAYVTTLNGNPVSLPVLKTSK